MVEQKGSNPMAVYKEEKTGTWRVIYRYTDWTGEKKQTQKRGFQTKREAQAWEREQLRKATSDLDMTFKSFVEQYTADMQTRIKENTWATKEHIIRSKLLPYFGKLKQEGKLKKLLNDAKKTIADLKAKIESLVTELSAVKAELAQYKSVRGKLRTADLEQENDRLRSRLRTYEEVISHNNLWPYFSRHREKTPTRDDVR